MSTEAKKIIISAHGLPRPVLVVICCVAVAVPFLLVQFPPITDLPQQTAQIRLLLETLNDPVGSEYRIQWFTPYSLSYLLLGLSWSVFGPENAGRMAMLAIGLAWVLAIHLVAIRRGRSQSAAVLGCLFFFSHILYWGFYSFAIGWPAFLLWFLPTTRKPAPNFTVREGLELVGAGLLLYVSHLLWFLAGLCWLGLDSLVLRRDFKVLLRRGAYLIPLIVPAIAWFPKISESSWATPALWSTMPLSRISLPWLKEAALGGIQGPIEHVLVGVSIGWVVLSVLQNRGMLKRRIDWSFLLLSGMFLSFVMCLPDKYMSTIRFGPRWMPMTAIALLLAMPPPILKPILRHALVLVLVAAFCLVTAGSWIGFERKELSGLKESLSALPERPTLLGLSYIQSSGFVKVPPFIQIFAYSQVLKGGKLNFSFAGFPPSLVVYKNDFDPPWTINLEWFPELVKDSDLKYFDFVLVNGLDATHESIRTASVLTPLTHEGRWRLYKVGERKERSTP
ncbi:MAG: hypothetical protein LDL33_12230 [Desulfomonile sp.]|nr:hypothetical protein [Desulfomonile sp.]